MLTEDEGYVEYINSRIGYRAYSNWQEEIKKVSQCEQRQDSVTDQLQDLIHIANKFGFYDAADFIKKRIEAK